MFGFVAANQSLLSEEQRVRYRACYCGLCHSLRERYGAFARFTLTYDMTFLLLVLDSMYEPQEKRWEASCPVHPLKKQPLWQSEITDYAADMNIALAYLNCIDDWRDDISLLSLAEAKLMEKAYGEIKAKYPRQCGVMEESIKELSEIEKTWKPMPDEASRCFGRLMAELFVYKEDFFSGYLRKMGMALGQFIYIMDACIDLKDDKRYYKYNPMKELYGRIDEMERFRGILEMLMGDCVENFEMLPLLQDADIIRNILCFGVWTQFNRHYNIKETKGAVPDGTGPL